MYSNTYKEVILFLARIFCRYQTKKLHGLPSNRLFTCWDKDIMEILALTAVENHHQSHNATLIGVNHLTTQIYRYSDTDKTDIVLFN